MHRAGPLGPHAPGGASVNWLAADAPDAEARASGANRSRLSQLKRRFDPGNLFLTYLVIAAVAFQLLRRRYASGNPTSA